MPWRKRILSFSPDLAAVLLSVVRGEMPRAILRDWRMDHPGIDAQRQIDAIVERAARYWVCGDDTPEAMRGYSPEDSPRVKMFGEKRFHRWPVIFARTEALRVIRRDLGKPNRGGMANSCLRYACEDILQAHGIGVKE